MDYLINKLDICCAYFREREDLSLLRLVRDFPRDFPRDSLLFDFLRDSLADLREPDFLGDFLGDLVFLEDAFRLDFFGARTPLDL